MLKQKRILKLYIGILVFGLVFSFKNVSERSFSQNVAKAMENSEPGNEKVVEILKKIRGKDFVECSNIHNVVKNRKVIIDNVRKIVEQSSGSYKEAFEKKLKLYEQFFDFIEQIANLEKAENDSSSCTHDISEFIGEFGVLIDTFDIKLDSDGKIKKNKLSDNVDDIIEFVGQFRGVTGIFGFKLDSGDKTKENELSDNELSDSYKTKINEFFNKSYILSRKIKSFVRELKHFEKEGVRYLSGACFIEWVKTLFDNSLKYLRGWDKAIVEILAYVYRNFDFVDFSEHKKEVEGEKVDGSKTIQSGSECLDEFFKHELIEPDEHFTGLSKEDLVLREDLLDIYNNIKGRYIELKEGPGKYKDFCPEDSCYRSYRKIEYELGAYRDIERTLKFDGGGDSKECVISRFRKKYNSMLEVLRKSKDDLTDMQKKDVKLLFEEVSKLAYYEIDKPIHVSHLSLNDDKYGKDYVLAEMCCRHNRYLYGWISTLNSIRRAIDKKFIYDDKDYKEINAFFEKGLFEVNEDPGIKSDKLISHSKVGFMYDKIEKWYKDIKEAIEKNCEKPKSYKDIFKVLVGEYNRIEKYCKDVKDAYDKNYEDREKAKQEGKLISDSLIIGNSDLKYICCRIEGLVDVVKEIDIEGEYKKIQPTLQKSRYSITHEDEKNISNVYDLLNKLETKLSSYSSTVSWRIDDIAEKDQDFNNEKKGASMRYYDVEYSKLGEEDLKKVEAILRCCIMMKIYLGSCIFTLKRITDSISSKFPFLRYDRCDILDYNKRGS